MFLELSRGPEATLRACFGLKNSELSGRPPRGTAEDQPAKRSFYSYFNVKALPLSAPLFPSLYRKRSCCFLLY